MNIKIFENFDELRPYREEWNNLVKQNETNTVFQLYEWILSWWNIYGNNHLCTIVAFEKNQIVGIAPFMIIDYGLRKNMIQFIGEGRADYCDFIIPRNKKEILELFIDYLLIHKNKWNYLHLNNISEQSSTIKILEEICNKGTAKKLVRRKINCPNIALNDYTHVKNTLKKKAILRRVNYFKKHGVLEFRHFDSKEEASANLNSFFQQHIERVEKKRMKSLFMDQKNKDFYREIIKNLFNTGYIKFSRVDYNNEALAYHFGFEYDNKYIWYKPSFNVKYSKYSPGSLLFKFLLEYSFNKKLNVFDFTIGNDELKSRYANKVNQNIQIEIYNNNYIYIFELIKLKLLRSYFKKIS